MNSRRMKMRATTSDDAKCLSDWYSQAELMKHVGFEAGYIVSEEDLIKRINNQKINEKLLMLTLLDDTPIGECHYKNIKGASCEVGIKIGDLSYQGKGYGKEGLQMLLAHLFGVLGMKMIFTDALVENERAISLYQSVGFKTTGTNKDYWIDPQGSSRSAVLMTLTLDEFKNSIKQPFKVY